MTVESSVCESEIRARQTSRPEYLARKNSNHGFHGFHPNPVGRRIFIRAIRRIRQFHSFSRRLLRQSVTLLLSASHFMILSSMILSYLSLFPFCLQYSASGFGCSFAALAHPFNKFRLLPSQSDLIQPFYDSAKPESPSAFPRTPPAVGRAPTPRASKSRPLHKNNRTITPSNGYVSKQPVFNQGQSSQIKANQGFFFMTRPILKHSIPGHCPWFAGFLFFPTQLPNHSQLSRECDRLGRSRRRPADGTLRYQQFHPLSGNSCLSLIIRDPTQMPWFSFDNPFRPSLFS